VLPEMPLDQASGLRQMLGGDSGLRAVGVFGGSAALNAEAVANLATAMTQRGSATWIFDETSPADSVAQHFGLAPTLSLGHWLRGACRLDSALVDSVDGVRLLACTQGAHTLADTAPETWAQRADELSQTAIDWLFLAAPADAQPSLAYAAPLRILVVQGSKNHLTEAYALLKSVHRQQPEGRWWILFSHLAEPERATLMMQAITETSRRFLEVEPGYLGVVAQDGKLELSARAMRPVLDFAPASGAASAFRNAAQTLAQTIQPITGNGIRDFWLRMGLISRSLARPSINRAADYKRGQLYR
jgi:flagellar biosynthesis protein FlhG